MPKERRRTVTTIAVNGLGRIGRAFLKAALRHQNYASSMVLSKAS
jgi:glyceraldehyde-3-phosphate dehydrogenase/erythrose-4-phosphate dehydrogenase